MEFASILLQVEDFTRAVVSKEVIEFGSERELGISLIHIGSAHTVSDLGTTFIRFLYDGLEKAAAGNGIVGPRSSAMNS